VRLYTYFRSGAAFRVRIALNLKGIDYTAQSVHLPKGEHRVESFAAVNPQALVPVLEDGAERLNQSLAIMEYLEEARPEPPLLPGDAPGRARVRSLALLVACEIHPLNNLRVLQHLRKALGQNEEQVTAWYRHWIADGLQRLEAELVRDARTGKYSHADSPTMADCCLVPQVFGAKRFQCDLAPYPTVMRVFDACMQLEAFDRAQPAKQPDAE
jgi:maleylacetoacetate isomerase